MVNSLMCTYSAPCPKSLLTGRHLSITMEVSLSFRISPPPNRAGARFPVINVPGVPPREPEDAHITSAMPEGGLLGALVLGFIFPCEKGLGREGHKLFLCSQPLSQEAEWSCPALGTDSSALFMGRKGGML